MKRIGALLLAVLMLSGCTGKRKDLDRAMELRARLLGCLGCSFTADITADYGNEIYGFSVDCQGDSKGNVTFTVTEPETLTGITGQIDGEGGRLTFDGTALAFELMADDQITPVSAPWIFLKTLLGGYLTACGREEELLRLDIDDSYEEDALHLEIWLDEQNLPVSTGILYNNRRIVTMEIQNFKIQ